MVKLIDGKKIAEKVKDKIALEIFEFKNDRPNLAIILVGEREDSKLYVSLKEKESVKVGIDTHIYRLSDNVLEEELLEVIDFLNHDPQVDGILIQLPLPKSLDTNKIIKALDPGKDVDGFHPNHPDYILSPVLAAVKASLEKTKINFKESSACLLYNADIFGVGLKETLEKLGISDFLSREQINEADVIVSALGKPETIKAENIKEGAVIIDISTVKVEGKVKGDADFDSLKDKASFITPVPGGIGPMTIAFLLKNVLEIFKRKNNFK
jgi:methylenetetrahydrofolate dehydrogenase (NADP+)/methenyltetrahydrofolate cyclohydrolase